MSNEKYTYFPKNGSQVNLFGIPVGRSGREFPFPVKDYETGVKLGILVRTPEEMDGYKPVIGNNVNIDCDVDDDLIDDINSQAESELMKLISNNSPSSEGETPIVEENKVSEDTTVKNTLTREEAFKYIKMEPDGTYAKHADGTYKIKGGWKPYTKEEIYKALESE